MASQGLQLVVVICVAVVVSARTGSEDGICTTSTFAHTEDTMEISREDEHGHEPRIETYTVSGQADTTGGNHIPDVSSTSAPPATSAPVPAQGDTGTHAQEVPGNSSKANATSVGGSQNNNASDTTGKQVEGSATNTTTKTDHKNITHTSAGNCSASTPGQNCSDVSSTATKSDPVTNSAHTSVTNCSAQGGNCSDVSTTTVKTEHITNNTQSNAANCSTHGGNCSDVNSTVGSLTENSTTVNCSDPANGKNCSAAAPDLPAFKPHNTTDAPPSKLQDVKSETPHEEASSSKTASEVTISLCIVAAIVFVGALLYWRARRQNRCYIDCGTREPSMNY